MKKTTAFLLTSACVLAISNNLFGMKKNSNNKNDMLVKENNLLLRTLIEQNNIFFHNSHDFNWQGHSKDFAIEELNNLYQSTNAQIKNKAHHIQMASSCTPVKSKKKKAHEKNNNCFPFKWTYDSL
jgi:hypothetical protein